MYIPSNQSHNTPQHHQDPSHYAAEHVALAAHSPIYPCGLPPPAFPFPSLQVHAPRAYHAHAPFSRGGIPPLLPFGNRVESLPPLWWPSLSLWLSLWLSPLDPPDLFMFMSLLSPLGGSGRPRRGDFMRSALVLVLLPMPMPIDEEDCLVAVVAAGGSGFPGALTTYIIRDGNYAHERCSTCEYICRSPRWSSWYPRKPSKLQVMGSSPGEVLFLTSVPGKIGRDFF